MANCLVNGGVYFVKESYFEKYNDPEMMNNEEGNRPYYFAWKAKEIEDLYLFIPASSNVEKYRKIIEKRSANKKPTDFIHITDIGNKESALLIHKMIPVTSEYVGRTYKYNGVHFQVIEDDSNSELSKKIKKIVKLMINEVPLTYSTNLKALIKEVLNEDI